MELMETTLDEFLEKHTYTEQTEEITLTFKDKRKILEKIWKALKCVWEYGGVYTDMKGTNVGVNPNSENLGESVIKLIDLGNICPRGTQPMNYTFAPPQKWILFQDGSGAPTLCLCSRCRDKCSEITLIWSFALAALIVLDFDNWGYISLMLGDFWTFDRVNEIMAEIQRILYGVYKDVPVGEDIGYLNWLKSYFRPYRKEDWRSDYNKLIPKKMKFKNIWKEVIKKKGGRLPKRLSADKLSDYVTRLFESDYVTRLFESDFLVRFERSPVQPSPPHFDRLGVGIFDKL